MVGQTVSHYRILEKLGEGGMGVVYKAEDEKLKRTVALKFVAAEALGDSETRARFCQEAQAAAALSHPNLCTVYEIDEECGFLAMELLDGETAQAKLRQRPLPLAEALDVAMQAAQGLQAAHERNIVHREIKSANIMITPKGGVKIMDFGLARVSDRTRLTKTGSAMGTPGYMSPEQAQGKDVDRRTDIWSLGVVLYEMATGRLPFRGDSDAAVVHSILHDDPEPVTALRAGVPLELDRLISKALAKDPADRYQHAEDFLVDLRALKGRLQQAPTSERRAAERGKRRMVFASVLGGVAIGALGAGLWAWKLSAAAPSPPVVRFSFELPPDESFWPTWNSGLVFSPDGQTLAMSIGGAGGHPGRRYILMRRLDSLQFQPLEEAKAMNTPVFAPDGNSLIAVDLPRMALHRVSLRGGGPVHFATADMHFRGDWGPGNYYYWTDGFFAPIIRTSVYGGKSEPVTKLDLEKQERTHRHAQVLPGGKALTFTVSSGGIETFDEGRIDAQILKTGERKTLVQGGFSARYSASGHLVYARDGAIHAIPFDAKSLAVTGSPVKVADGVFMSRNSGSAYFDVSRAGALAYAEGKGDSGERSLVWVDRSGNESPLPLPPRAYLFPRVSPDGKQVAFEVEGVNHDLYIYDPDRNVTTKLTTDGVSHSPVWTPDGKRIAFRSWKMGTMTMWWMPADRSAPEERLTMEGARQSLVSFSPDGRYATFNQMELDGTRTNIYVLPIVGERKPQPLVKSSFMEGSARFSPDGKWVAYCTDESGRNEVFVQPWPGPGPKIQISSEGGTDPIFSRDGKELFYRNGDKMMVVAIANQPEFRASRPQILWQKHFSHGMSSSCGPPGTTEANYDVTTDAKRFLMVKDLDQDAASRRIVVVLNFAEELKRAEREKKK